MAKNGEYFKKLFHLTKRNNANTICEKGGEFNDTEIRLFSEIIEAKNAGKRLISTQLADRLGITRSAISQLVNRLEERNMVKRVADDVDRKIAYIELTEQAISIYQEEKSSCCKFVEKILAAFGKEKLDTLLALNEEFIATVSTIRGK